MHVSNSTYHLEGLMKFYLLILSLVIGTLAIPGTASALDPSVFLKVLNVDIEQLQTRSGDFTQVQKQLGITKQIDKGDASEYEGRVEYILSSRPEMFTLFITECTGGYRVTWISTSERSGKTIMKPNVQKIEVGGLYLGMNRKEIEKIFMGTPSGGWTIEENKKMSASQKVIYRKTVEGKSIFDAKKIYFCDRIWIIMKFDKRSKLSEYDIETGGCDDSACERN
jgi:hypothetical protein